MEKELKEKGIAVFEGLNITKTKVVKLKFLLRYDEMITSVNLLQGLNSDITVHAKVPDRKPMNLGVFNVGSVNFDKDGNAKVLLESMLESVDMDSIYEVAAADYIVIMFRAVLDLPDYGDTDTV